MKAKVAYTYGWTDDVIEAMSYKTFLEYWRAITIIEAEEQLKNFESACSPHIKKEARKESTSRYKRILTSMIDKAEGRLATVQDLAKAFARMKMNG